MRTSSRQSGGAGRLITLASFNSSNGALPFGGLVADASGNLYGTTSAEGADGFGTVFKVTDIGSGGGGAGAVPEPANWALMIAGFCIVGAVLRRRVPSIAA